MPLIAKILISLMNSTWCNNLASERLATETAHKVSHHFFRYFINTSKAKG